MFPEQTAPSCHQLDDFSLFTSKFWRQLQFENSGIAWVWPPPRIITFLVGDSELNLHLPLLVGGGHTQGIAF